MNGANLTALPRARQHSENGRATWLPHVAPVCRAWDVTLTVQARAIGCADCPVAAIEGSARYVLHADGSFQAQVRRGGLDHDLLLLCTPETRAFRLLSETFGFWFGVPA